jgi:hypothetical protein
MALMLRACLMLAMVAPFGQVATWTDTFSERRVDPWRWHITSDGDFREWSVQVAELPQANGSGRLALRADTRGSSDETVKFLGVRSVPSIDLDRDVRIAVDLDWNSQSNGSYLSAAIVLSPSATSQSPFNASDWLKVEYVGVPPGRNARMVIGLKQGGHERTLDNEGWPGRGRQGRPIGVQHLVIVCSRGALQVWENGMLAYESKEKVIGFATAYLYLQMSSHSNYSARTVYFDNVRVEQPHNP